ncbi:DUF2058 family protein [Escherichia coli]
MNPYADFKVPDDLMW